MGYPIKMRLRAIELLDEGKTQEFVAKLLNISVTTVKRWKNHIEKEGSFSSVYDSSNRKAPKVP